jgi:EpsI family protein
LSRSHLQNGLLFAALVGVGAVAWALQLSSRLQVDPSGLAALPLDLGAWHAQDVPVEDGVAAMLRADFHVQRFYRHPLGSFVWVYVGYYGTARGGRPEHTPWVCYPASGWQVERSRVVEVDPARGLRANELLVQREGERRLVLFWYRSATRTGITSGLALSLAHLRDRLLRGRADAALVRLSTVVDGDDETTARTILIGFARDLDPELASHWPREQRPL